MKAFVLAAGEGRRLRPLTDRVPKCLVPVQGTPLLEIWLRLLEASGVTAALVNRHHLSDDVREFLSRRQGRLDVRSVHEQVLLGSAGTVAANRDFVAEEREFLVVYGDVLTNANLVELVARHRDAGVELTVGVVKTDRPQEKGIVVVDADARIVSFQEKPKAPLSDLANAGIYVASPGLFEYLAHDAPPPYDFGVDVLPKMVGRMQAVTLDGYLSDIGTPAAYRAAQEEWPGLAT